MEERYIMGYKAFKEFVDDLQLVFGNKKEYSPLALYGRMLEKIDEAMEKNNTNPTPSSKKALMDSINRVMGGFKSFYGKNEIHIMNGNLDNIPEGTCIHFINNDMVYIDIKKYLNLCSDFENGNDIKKSIQKHLLTINTIIETDKTKFKELGEKLKELDLDTTSKEGEFIMSVMKKAQENMSDMDTSDPTMAIMGLMSGGVINDMVGGLQEGINSGELNINNLVGSIQGMIGQLVPPQEPVKPTIQEVEEIDNVVAKKSGKSPSLK